MIDDAPETPDSQREHDQAAEQDDQCTDGEHPAWCSPEYCYVTDDGVRVHEQAPIRWEDDEEEVRCETRLLDPTDEPDVYLEFHLQNLRLCNQFHWAVSVAAARRLRDQLTAHLDVAQ